MAEWGRVESSHTRGLFLEQRGGAKLLVGKVAGEAQRADADPVTQWPGLQFTCRSHVV